jgi:GAF domain-containing protein
MAVCKPRPDLHFLQLQASVFCTECELISQNNTPRCLACGSQAVLGLSRVLGGSLRREPTATLILDAAMDRLVRNLLSTVPSIPMPAQQGELIPIGRGKEDALIAARKGEEEKGLVDGFSPALLDLEPAISVIAERAQSLTNATGSAIGLRWGNEVVCSARAGRTAPDLGVRLQAESGLSGECVRSGQILRCDDAEDHPNVDAESCRRLGVRSILVAPLHHFRKMLGIFEVLSSEPYAFDDLAVAHLQMLAGFMVATIARAAGLKSVLDAPRLVAPKTIS